MAIINTYDQLKAAAADGFDKRGLVGVGYHHPDYSNSRDVSCQQWRVFSPFRTLHPTAHWTDNGAKVFLVFGDGATHKERKAAALAKALAWAEKNCGVKEWAKNRIGAYVPKEVNDKFPIPKREKPNEANFL